jgi:hypothetical protein
VPTHVAEALLPRLARPLAHALARISGGRVVLDRPDCSDPVFRALLLNLSHVMHDDPDSADVLAAARLAWQALLAPPVDPFSAWPADRVAELRAEPSLLLLAPVGPTPIDHNAGITSPAPQRPEPRAQLMVRTIEPGDSPPVDFFSAPASFDLDPFEAALADQRSVWLGWLARYPGGLEGELHRFAPAGVAPPSAAQIASLLARWCEQPMRTYPDQLRAVTPFWREPFHATNATVR